MFTQLRYGLIVAVGAATLLCASAADATADDASRSNAWGQFMQTMNPVNWRLPALPQFRSILPKSEENARIRKKGDSLIDEVSKTASGSWQRTKDALNPQRFAPNVFTASAKTASRPEPPKRKTGFFRSLFPAPETAPAPKDPADFLNQPRVQP